MINTDTLKSKLREILNELGLRNQEIDLYIASLVAGPASIARLADILGLSRPNIYKLVAGLEKVGLVKFSQRKKYSRKLSVEPPVVIIEKMRLRNKRITLLTNDASDLMPRLSDIYFQDSQLTNVKILKSDYDYVQAVNEMIEKAVTEICFFGSFDHFLKTVTFENFNNFTRLRSGRNLVSRTLIFESENYENLKLNEFIDNRIIKIIKNFNQFKTSFQISQDVAIIWQPVAPLAILIEDKYIVEMFRSIFEFMWRQTE